MASEMRQLRRCRVLWGSCDLREAPPTLVSLRNAVYDPGCEPASWSIRDGTGALVEAGEGFSHPPGQPAATDRLSADADHLFIGPLIPHYGHFLIGTLARLWPLLGWSGARPRLLYRRCEDGAGSAGPLLAATLQHFGFSEADLVSVDRPVCVPRLVVPGVALRERTFAHAVQGALCRAIGRPLWDPMEVDREARPVYLSKGRLRAGIARLLDEDALCERLACRGVAIVEPETLSLEDQVRLMARHRVVMGTTSSAFHTALLSAPGRRLLGLNWAAHLNANFPLIDGLAGSVGRYYHAPGTREVPADGFQFGWRIPDPAAVADELVERAERFDALDAIDEAEHRGRGRAARWITPVRALARRLRPP